jgi:hypothetical protein
MIMRKYAGVLLMVCLIAGSAFATNSWTASTGSWGTPADWSNGVPAATEQVKIKDGTTCTVDVTTCVMGIQKLTVGTSDIEAVLNVVSGGTLNAGAEVQIGGDGGIRGRINQTGGTVNLVNGTASAKIEVGYKTGGVGYYTISGGSIVGDALYSQLQVGASGASGGTGTFTVVGTGGSISISKLYVGASTSIAQYTGTGTLAFEIDGGVSAINAGSVYIDPTNLVAAVANLSVTKTGALPTGGIILINNTGINGVTGAFDNVAWGGTVTLGGVNYTLTNTYIGGLDGLANDVALIPELIPDMDTFTLTYTAGANGSIIGTTPQTVNSGTNGTAVTAQTALGYHFVKWSDDSTANPRTDLNVTANITVQASFAIDGIDTFTLTYTAGANGSIVGTTPQAVDYGTSGTAVTAQPATGYHFAKWSDDSTANPRTDVNVTANITVQASFAIDMIVIASKCKVAAGKTQAWDDTYYGNMTDAFTASGTLNLPDNVNDINSVVVVITSTTDGEVIYPETLEFDPTVVNKTGKYKYKGEAGNITSMTLDFRKGTFAIAAKNIDLTGLACPFEIKFTMGSNELKGNVDEGVVNGTKTIPTRFMRMYKDTLIVPPGKAKAKNGTSALSDSLSVSGEIAVEDINTTEPNLYGIPVVITWGSKDDANNVQTFTIPEHSFKIPKTGHAYKCSKVVDPNGIVTATIDLDKCTFAISISKANLVVTSGDVVFGIRFADFNEPADVTLP